jgi:hypothetical protein
MQTDQYHSQKYYYQISQGPSRANGGNWIVTGVVIGTILLATLVSLALILIINGANKNYDYAKNATVPTIANSPAIGGKVTTGAADYTLPVSPLATRITLNRADDRQITESLKKFGFKNGRYEIYKVDLNTNISAIGNVKNFYYLELQKLGWKYSEARSGVADSVDIYEKGHLATYVMPFIVGYDVSDSKYSYAGIKSGDAVILVMTGEYDDLKPAPTSIFQDTNS